MIWKGIGYKGAFALCLAVALMGCSDDVVDLDNAEKAGQDGATSLVESTDEPAGDNCAAGGVRIDIGIDLNGDGQLQEDEITATTYICHGEEGEDGEDGEKGEKGEKGEDGEKGEKGEDGKEGTAVGCSGDLFEIVSVTLEEDPWDVYEIDRSYGVTVTFSEDPGDNVVFSAVGPQGDFADGFARVAESDLEFHTEWTLESQGAFHYTIIATDGCALSTSNFAFPGTSGQNILLDLTSSVEDLPMNGGDAEICWNSRNADECELTQSYGDPSDDFTFDGTEGCETISVTATIEVELTCSRDHGTSSRSDSLHIQVGPNIRFFEALTDTALLPSEDSVEFAWDTGNVDSCELFVNGEAQSVDLSASESTPHVVAFTENSEVYLECTDSDDNSVISDTIFVGTQVVLENFVAEITSTSSNQIRIGWSADVENVGFCAITAENGSYDESRSIWIGQLDDYGNETIGNSHEWFAFNPNYDFIFGVYCEDPHGESTATESIVMNPGPKAALETVGSPIMDGPGDVEFYWTTSEVSDCELVIDGDAQSVDENRPANDPFAETFTEMTEVYLQCVDDDSNPVMSNTILVATGAAIISFEPGYTYDDNHGNAEFEWSAQMLDVDSCEVTVENGSYTTTNSVTINEDYQDPRYSSAQRYYYISGDYDPNYDLTATLSCESAQDSSTITRSIIINPGPKVALETVDSPIMDGPGDVEFYWTTSEVSDCELVIDGDAQSVDENRPASDPFAETFTEMTEVYLQCMDDDSNPVTSDIIVVFTGTAILSLETTYVDLWEEYGEAYFGWSAQMLNVDSCEMSVENDDYTATASVTINEDSQDPRFSSAGNFEYVIGDYDSDHDLTATLSCESSTGGDPVERTIIIEE